jgi:hypothetical protein
MNKVAQILKQHGFKIADPELQELGMRCGIMARGSVIEGAEINVVCYARTPAEAQSKLGSHCLTFIGWIDPWSVDRIKFIQKG